MSVKINSLIDNLLNDNLSDIDDDIEYYNHRIFELNNQIKYYCSYSKNCDESDKKIIQQEILELSNRKTYYEKLRDNLTPKCRERTDSDLIFPFDE